MFSLYGKDSKRLTPAMLETFDVLVYDIQDVGSRYYTFLSTLAYLIEDCAKSRQAAGGAGPPRPTGRRDHRGTTLRPGMESFVGCYPPPRYALTIGEFAQMVNAEQHFWLRPYRRTLHRLAARPKRPGLGHAVDHAQPQHPQLRNGSALRRHLPV